MKLLMSSAVLIGISLALSACASGHHSTGGAQETTTVARAGRYTVSQPLYSENHLPRSLLRRIAAEARQMTKSLGDSSVKTADVYGPRSRLALVKASAPGSAQLLENARAST